MQAKKESLLSQRGWMAVIFIGLWGFLCAWSLSAFWQHIDSLQPTYRLAAKAGACAGEFAVLALTVLKCFSIHINVRKWSLILACALAIVIVFHTGALRGLDEAAIVQDDKEKRLRDSLTQMSKEQGVGRTQKERMATANKANSNAQKLLADTINKRDEAIKATSFFPLWYLNGGMYALIMIASILCLGFVGMKMLNKEDIDRNFDGIADHLQQPTEVNWPNQVGK